MKALVALLLGAATASAVAPVRGPSWLQHLGLALGDTHLGKQGGDGPPPAGTREPAPPGSEGAQAEFTVGGGDLYRFSCRACHGPAGRGAPPEIHPLLDPVRATSAAVLEARQRERGHPLPPGMAGQLAADAERALLDRIAHGGKGMPAFPQLSKAEVSALVGHLDALSGISAGAPAPPALNLSAARVGELIVKGTCHVCHPATGSNPGHMEMYMRGVIPSLASVATERTASAVVAKVREGRMTMMGGGMMGGGMMGGGMMGGGMWRDRGRMGRMGRMPVFSYLTDEEVRAVYLYLSKYPPVPE